MCSQGVRHRVGTLRNARGGLCTPAVVPPSRVLSTSGGGELETSSRGTSTSTYPAGCEWVHEAM